MPRSGVSSSFMFRWALNAVALLIVSALSDGVNVSGPLALLLAALVLGFVNALIRPAVFILTLPITLVTLGLFAFVVNGIMIWLTAALVPGFHVAGLWASVWAAILMTIVSALLNMVVRDR